MNETTKAEIHKRLGNIRQLRELLFGEQLAAYDSQLAQYHQRLAALETHWQQSQLALQDQITASINQSEKKLLEQINLVAQEYRHKTEIQEQKQQELEQQLDTLAQHSRENIDCLHQSLNSNTNSLKAEIAQYRSDLEQNLTEFKQLLLTTLETNLGELTIKTISRAELAEVLAELSLKFKP